MTDDQRRLSNGMTIAEAAAKMAAIPGKESMTKEQLLEAVLRKSVPPPQVDGTAPTPTPAPVADPPVPRPAESPLTSAPPSASTPAPPIAPTPSASAPTPTSAAPKHVPPSTPAQRASFIQSLAQYYKQEGIPRPVELFNTSRLGAILIDGKEFHVVDLFLHIVRGGGINKVSRALANAADGQILKVPHNAPLWTEWLDAMGQPRTIPETTLVGSTEAKTTDIVTYFLSLYNTHLAGFAAFMSQKNRKGTPSTPVNGAGPSPAPSPASSTPSKPIPTPVAPAKPGSPGKKRKRENTAAEEAQESPSVPPTPATPSAGPSTSVAPPAPSVPPPEPSRTRYKVTYEPLHYPNANLGGWDERAVSSAFTKYNLLRPTRSVNELGIVDMEVILMGLRSRIPRELGYALTVLAMLSMDTPENGFGGLQLQRLNELFYELLEFIESAVFGEDGYDVWLARQPPSDPLTLATLERSSRNFDFSMMDTDADRQEVSRGSTDHALSALNILRNLSMHDQNHGQMASEPALMTLLSRITDSRLARLSGAPTPENPYSLLEFARVRRDALVILTNIGRYVMLRRVPFDSVHAIFRLLSSQLVSGFDITSREGLYGPADRPPPIFVTLYNALEALCKLSERDQNREVLGRIPEVELVEVFGALVKMFPLTKRADAAMHTSEHVLGFTETLSMTLYNLAFMSSLSARRSMRSIPGAVPLIKRLIFETISRHTDDFRKNPFGILTRRLCEVLGVLNGTATPAGESGLETMGFSAGAGDGKGWRWASGVLDKGWMSCDEERIVEGLSVPGVDAHAFGELDGMWWGD